MAAGTKKASHASNLRVDACGFRELVSDPISFSAFHFANDGREMDHREYTFSLGRSVREEKSDAQKCMLHEIPLTTAIRGKAKSIYCLPRILLAYTCRGQPLMLPAGKKLCLLTNCEQWYWTRGNIYFTREYSTEFPAQCSASIFQSCSAPNRNQIILTVPWKKLSCNFSNILARLFWHMARPSYKKRDGEKKVLQYPKVLSQKWEFLLASSSPVWACQE